MKKSLLFSLSFMSLMTVGMLVLATDAQSSEVVVSDMTKSASAPGNTSVNATGDEKISVAKAIGPNAITVAEAFSNGAKWDKKKVIVNGKVVKVSTSIMKRNWIHIQDGTGSLKKKTNNLVCTSKDMAAVGDVVSVRGVLAIDRDFGSGYSYKAIIENAEFAK